MWRMMPPFRLMVINILRKLALLGKDLNQCQVKKKTTPASCSLRLGPWNLFSIMKVNKRQQWQTIKERHVQVQDISGLHFHPASF